MAILKYFGKVLLYFLVFLVLANVSLWALANMKFKGGGLGLALLTLQQFASIAGVFLLPWVLAALPLKKVAGFTGKAVVYFGLLLLVGLLSSTGMGWGVAGTTIAVLTAAVAIAVVAGRIRTSPARARVVITSNRESWMDSNPYNHNRFPAKTHVFSIAKDPDRLVIEEAGHEPIWGRPGHVLWRTEPVFYEMENNIYSHAFTGKTASREPTSKPEPHMSWRRASSNKLIVEQCAQDDILHPKREILYSALLSRSAEKELVKWLYSRRGLLSPDLEQVKGRQEQKLASVLAGLRKQSGLPVQGLREDISRDARGEVISYIAASEGGDFYGWCEKSEVRGSPKDIDTLQTWKIGTPGACVVPPDIIRRIQNATWKN